MCEATEMSAEVSAEEMIAEPELAEETVSDATAEKLAEDFLELQQELPEITDIGDVPEAVLQMAVEQQMPLLDAYLRHRLREQRAILAEQERQQRVEEQSAGSLYTGSVQTHPEADAFARAFETALH